MAQSELPSGPPRLLQAERAKVFDKACSKVAKLYFDPAFRGVDWLQHVAKNRESVISRTDPVEFEAGVHEIFRALGTSHTGFFHESVRRVPYRLAIGVTCTRQPKSDSTSWVVRDVHERGPGAVAGLEPGDELVALDGEPIRSDSPPMLPMGTSVSLQVLRSGNPVDLKLAIPLPRSTKQPYSEPQSVVQKLLPGGIGYIKVSILPGLIGIDVAKEIDSAFSAISGSNALILDLRGHLGGGLGVLRLMSHLTPHRLPIGYLGDERPEKANVIVRRQQLNSASNDIGFARDAQGQFRAVVSDYDRGIGFDQGWVGRVAQAYKECQTMAVARSRGYVFQGRSVLDTPQGKKVQLRFAVR